MENKKQTHKKVGAVAESKHQQQEIKKHSLHVTKGIPKIGGTLLEHKHNAPPSPPHHLRPHLPHHASSCHHSHPLKHIASPSTPLNKMGAASRTSIEPSLTSLKASLAKKTRVKNGPAKPESKNIKPSKNKK